MKQKVVIIGAGISGLYLAYLLEDKFDVTILEARDRVGGRIYSIDSHDMGPSWIWSHHKQILCLIKKFDQNIFAQYTQGHALYESRGKVEAFSPLPSAPSARVEGSLSSLINSLHNSLKNTEMLLSHEVKNIKEAEDEIVLRTTAFENFSCDYVVSTLAPRLAAKIDFEPPLPKELLTKMQNTQTWMGNSAKCVVEFTKAFWREKGLSGFAFSHTGPLGEIHDASTKTKAALFGFVSSHAVMTDFDSQVKAQMCRLLDIDESEILSVHLIDWRQERFTATEQDAKPMSQHPEYGIDTSSYSDKIFFSSTEFSFEEGGYLEGAVLQAQKIAAKLLE
jgi:monoamine oxidase